MSTSSEDRTSAVYERVLGDLPERIHLCDIDYRDELNNDQVQQLITGSDYPEGLDEYIDERRIDGAHFEIDKLLGPEEVELLQDADLWDALRFEIMDRDTSDPFTDLMRNTPDKMVRYDLGIDVDTGWGSTPEEYGETADLIAGTVGLPDQRETIIEVLEEAGDGGRAFIIWNADVSDLYEATCSTETCTISWKDPTLLVLNRICGSGMDGTLNGTVTLPFDRSNLAVDERGAGTGYSWTDDVAGIARDAYRTDCKITINERRQET